MTAMMIPMTSKGMSSAVTGVPIAPRNRTPAPPAKPMPTDPQRAPMISAATTAII